MDGTGGRAAAVTSSLAGAILAGWIAYDVFLLPKSSGADIGLGIAALFLGPVGLWLGIVAIRARISSRFSVVAWCGVLMCGGVIALGVLGAAGAY